MVDNTNQKWARDLSRRGFLGGLAATTAFPLAARSAQVEPNKRPLSSMSPTIMARDGEPFLTVGSPGGPTIVTSVVQAILHHVEYDLPLIDAIGEPSIYAPNSPEITLWEEGIPEGARTEAADLGNEWAEEPSSIGNINMLRANDTYEGAADRTRDGLAVGLSDQ